MDSTVNFLKGDGEYLLKTLQEDEAFPQLQETIGTCLTFPGPKVSITSTVEFFREVLSWSMSNLPEEKRIHEALELAIEFPHYY